MYRHPKFAKHSLIQNLPGPFSENVSRLLIGRTIFSIPSNRFGHGANCSTLAISLDVGTLIKGVIFVEKKQLLRNFNFDFASHLC